MRLSPPALHANIIPWDRLSTILSTKKLTILLRWGGSAASMLAARLERFRMRAEVVRQLEEDIVFGVLHPKEKLIEESLATRLQQKRHVIRDALEDLEVAGLVTRIPNRGAFVRELTATEVIEIYEVREILEVAAAM